MNEQFDLQFIHDFQFYSCAFVNNRFLENISIFNFELYKDYERTRGISDQIKIIESNKIFANGNKRLLFSSLYFCIFSRDEVKQ